MVILPDDLSKRKNLSPLNNTKNDFFQSHSNYKPTSTTPQ